MKNRILLMLMLVGLSQSASWAQSNRPTQEELMLRTQAAIEAAAAQARSMSARPDTQKSDANPLSPEALRANKQNGVDIGSIANKFQETPFQRPKMNQDLIIFVSTSLPPAALEKLGREAAMAGGVLVLRGIRGKLGQRGSLDETMRLLKPAAETGASIQIDPEQFKLYNVTAVPTFVLTHREDQCGNDQCASQALALSGDVSLEYALETWVDRGGYAAKQASVYLQRIRSHQSKD